VRWLRCRGFVCPNSKPAASSWELRPVLCLLFAPTGNLSTRCSPAPGSAGSRRNGSIALTAATGIVAGKNAFWRRVSAEVVNGLAVPTPARKNFSTVVHFSVVLSWARGYHDLDRLRTGILGVTARGRSSLHAFTEFHELFALHDAVGRTRPSSRATSGCFHGCCIHVGRSREVWSCDWIARPQSPCAKTARGAPRKNKHRP